jgi:hypothetical protein
MVCDVMGSKVKDKPFRSSTSMDEDEDVLNLRFQQNFYTS